MFGLALSALLFAPAENWPQWRGPAGDGVSRATGLPTKWGKDENVRWSLPMPGMGNSTPCLWGDRLVFTSESGDQIVALCVSTAGKLLWTKPLGSATAKARTDEGNGASASPCTDGDRVYCMAGDGMLAAFTLDGTEAWRVDLQERYGKFRIQFGMHSTPVLHRGRLYGQLLHSAGQHLFCLDAATGNEVWHVKRPSDGRDECEHSYASPVLWTRGDDALLISHGNDYCTAHSLTDGKEVWRLGDLNPKAKYNPTLRFVATPLATPDLIVVPTAKGGAVVGVDPGSRGPATERWRRNRDTPDVPSPTLVDGRVYLCRETGVLICLDAKTGQEVYSQGTHRAKHRASPVAADGKLYLTARDATVSVVQLGPDFKLLATNRLPDDMGASPVVGDGCLYLRGYKTLYCVGRSKE